VYPSQPVIGQFAESLNPSMEAYKRCASPPLLLVSLSAARREVNNG